MHASKIEELKCSLNFDGAFAVDRIGRGGGVVVLWRKEVNCRVISYASNFIDMDIKEDNQASWRLTGGYPERARRRDSWRLLRQLSNSSSLPWCIMGDFNDMLNLEDKCGRCEHPQYLFDGFRETIRDYNLFDLPLEGYPFTWWCRRGSDNAVEERIDRAMVSPSWSALFPNAKLSNLIATISDHSPILLNYRDKVFLPSTRRFKFENAWLLEDGIDDIVHGSWYLSGRNTLLDKLKGCADDIQVWGRGIHSKFRLDINRCKNKLADLVHLRDEDSIRLFNATKEKLAKLLLQEDDF